MKPDIAVAGFIGLVIGGLIFFAAYWYKDNLPSLIESSLGVGIAFSVLLLIALSEMPVMVWGLQRMVRDPSTPRAVVLGTHAVYNSFAAVYAAAFILATGKELLALILVGLGLLRFVTGIWVR